MQEGKDEKKQRAYSAPTRFSGLPLAVEGEASHLAEFPLSLPSSFPSLWRSSALLPACHLASRASLYWSFLYSAAHPEEHAATFAARSVPSPMLRRPLPPSLAGLMLAIWPGDR